jgi:hypothetical protein
LAFVAVDERMSLENTAEYGSHSNDALPKMLHKTDGAAPRNGGDDARSVGLAIMTTSSTMGLVSSQPTTLIPS